MTKPQVKIVDLETGQETIRDMNTDELTQMQTDKAAAKIEIDQIAAKAAERAALLAKLGITEDEAKLLLG